MSSRLMKNALQSLVILGLVLVSLSVVVAQDAANRILTPGVAVNGTLNTANPIQVYTYVGTAEQSVSFIVSEGNGFGLDVVITDVTGAPLAPAANAGGAAVSGSLTKSYTLPADGTYYVNVVAVDSLTDATVNFELSAAVASAASGVTFTEPVDLLTATGIQVALQWSSTANLDLEVRDPVGGSLRFATPSVNSGGVFGTNVNSVCNALSSNAPTEQATWPAGVVPTGSYEILVYYQPLDACPTTDSVSFGVNVTVDGTAVPAFQGTLRPNEVFIASVVVNEDGSVKSGSSGLKVDPPALASVKLDNATPIARDTAVSGVITSEQPYQVYSFTGVANDVVSVQMNATSGSLDTLLMLVDPNGNSVSMNDDAAQGVTNSAVTNLSLILPGEYKIVATRYGQDIGGTEGGYTLTVTGALSDTTNNQTAQLPLLPNLPAGSVQVSLQWSTAADLRLLVRDPQGDTVFVDKPQIPSGGRLAASNNVKCANTSASPVSYIYWPEGRLPNAGPYEIEVQYQNQCNDTRPVVFTLNVVANGQLVLSKTQQIFLDERFVTSYSIDTNGAITAGDGGIFGTLKAPDSSTLDYTSQIETAQVLTNNQSVNGSIRQNKKFDLYVFDGQAGQVATIGMQGRNGTLDTVLFLLDPNGTQAAQNDDASGETTDSVINEFTLPEDGRYIIIATHFGGLYGVTSGDYTLTLRLN
ncbi:MAG: PPC domain-containing protein [Chloroflexota bacterium]